MFGTAPVTPALLGTSVVGSGQFGTPCERMQAAHLRFSFIKLKGLDLLGPFGTVLLGLLDPQPAITSTPEARTTAVDLR